MPAMVSKHEWVLEGGRRKELLSAIRMCIAVLDRTGIRRPPQAAAIAVRRARAVVAAAESEYVVNMQSGQCDTACMAAMHGQ